MSRLLARTAAHTAGALHHCYVIWTSSSIASKKYEDPVINVAMDYGPRYLTYWNFTLQTVFLAVSLYCDIAEWSHHKISKRWSRFKEIIFHALVFPFTLYVFIIFWSLYALDREYVYPEILDSVMPWWLNHSVHTNILLVLATEILVQPRPYPQDGPYYKVFVVTAHIYALLYHETYFVNGVWLYQFYYLLNWPLRFLWHIKFITALHVFYYLQWRVLRYLYEDKKGNRQIELNDQNKINGFNDVNGNNVNGKKNW